MAAASGAFFVCGPRAAFLARYAVQTVGGSKHREYWIPPEELKLVNENIVGAIEVVAEYR